uniref:Splicing factor 3b, subunit 1 n=1 Tax=Lates calcarifer TaxID=8187 RepID=A0A4W6FEY0_LATCA
QSASIKTHILEIQGMKASLLAEDGEQGVGLDSTGFYDQEIYGGSDSRFAGYVTSIAANEQEDDDEDDTSTSLLGQKKPGYHAPVAILNAIPQSDEQYDPFAEHRPQKIAEREDEYKARRRQMIISPERLDPFADGKFSHFLFSLHLPHFLPLQPVSFFPFLLHLHSPELKWPECFRLV